MQAMRTSASIVIMTIRTMTIELIDVGSSFCFSSFSVISDVLYEPDKDRENEMNADYTKTTCLSSHTGFVII